MAWPEIVSEDLKDICVREFLAGTSTDALREYVCSVCGEGVTSASLHPEGVPFSDVHLDLFWTGFKSTCTLLPRPSGGSTWRWLCHRSGPRPTRSIA